MRPLALRWGSFGDLIMMTPVLKALAERAGEPVDLLAAGPWSRTMFDGSPWVGRVWTLNDRNIPWFLHPGKRAIIRDLKQRAQGPLWVFDDHPQARKFCEAAKWPAEMTSYPDPGSLPKRVIHAVDQFWHYADITPTAFDLEPLKKPERWQWELPPAEGDAENCRLWLDKIGIGDAPTICLQVGNRKTMRAGSLTRSSNHKHWPGDNWLAVIRGLRELEPDAHLLLIGSPSEADMTEVLAKQAADTRVISVAREFSIPLLLGLLERSRGLVSVDTGPAHAAAAIGCPLVVLFASTDPRTCGPQGERVTFVCPEQREGFDWEYSKWEPMPMSRISPEDVLSAWRDQLQRDASPRIA